MMRRGWVMGVSVVKGGPYPPPGRVVNGWCTKRTGASPQVNYNILSNLSYNPKNL